MTFALNALRALNRTGARVVVAATQGSVPREVGASMLVTDTGASGTIGGGALEFAAIERARQALQCGKDRIDRIPLGPGVGQCCGGAVTLLTEIWDGSRLASIDTVAARCLPGVSGEMPLSVRRILADARGSGLLPAAGIVEGWMIEPVHQPTREIWVWGAGHVGRAIVGALAPLPGLTINWADTDSARFPSDVPSSVETLIAANPADLVTLSGSQAEHYVLTYSHPLDLELCHRILARPFRFLGLIGSQTKRARFRKRLLTLGHSQAQIDRMTCPIGDPSLGKHPQAIALGVATALLKDETVAAGQMVHRA
ncbi:MAG: xanthine dehydrogenase accessory protein XdhC [Pseudomonadota bacterium]